ncbi:MAG: GSCFA domain-containing protein [Flavobacteriaceae bacterium]|nr:GSCFA domain-containing protein [Flavobacteriaceae bacterium]
MNFFTQIEPAPSGVLLNTDSRITALGSCFAQVIGQRLTYYKWPVVLNPLGVLFHPLALQDLVRRALLLDEFKENDLFKHEGRYHILALHGQYSSQDSKSLLIQANSDLKILRDGLTKATHVLITLGTAWAYQKSDNEVIVGNCHKLPGSFFNKKLLSVAEIQQGVAQIIELMAKYNAEAQLIFSVSPVRHTKDGMVQNSLGKAHLIAGLHGALNQGNNTPIVPKYFPAYELMMDQLRDYRFYKSDLIHPNDQGEEVVWEFFKDHWINPELEALLRQIKSIQQGLAHRPIHSDSTEHHNFVMQLKKRIENLERQYPHLKFD